jgi:uncharacterized protein (TIGR04222 family)
VNPFDLPGPDFLEFYLAAAAIALVVAAWLRLYLRQPADDGDVWPAALSPYHLAYLAGGRRLAVHAAVAALVQRGTLRVDRASRSLSTSESSPQGAPRLEREAHKRVVRAGSHSVREGSLSLRELQGEALPELERIREDLERDGLAVSASRAWVAQCLPLILVLAMALTGLVKILVGLSRHRPVGFLAFLVFLTVVVAAVGFGRPVLRSRRGDRVLARARPGAGGPAGDRHEPGRKLAGR